MLPTITELHAALTAPGAHAALIERVLAEAGGAAATAVYTALLPETARAAARAADAALAAGTPGPRKLGPLAGLPVTVKDLYDIAGRTTMAGSVLRAGAPAAAQDAEAVLRLKQAGAAITGLTNMTEFAFSGVGINPHHGTPRNPADTAVLGELVLPRSVVERTVRSVYGDPAKVTPALVDRYFELTLRAGNRAALGRRMDQVPLEADVSRLRGLQVPTLILWGGMDRLIPPGAAQRFKADLPNSTLVLFDALGHVPHEEDPQATVAALEAFLSEGS